METLAAHPAPPPAGPAAAGPQPWPDRPAWWPIRPPLEAETRAYVDTATAAHHLNRRPQTLRIWAMREDGPLRPIRVNGRLGWAVADIRRVLGVKP